MTNKLVKRVVLLTLLLAAGAATPLMAWPMFWGQQVPAQAPSISAQAPGEKQPPANTCGITAQGTGVAQAPPNYPGFPGDTATPTPPEDPKPANPVQKICEGGKIVIQVGNLQHFGHHIMDHVGITVLILADDSVMFDFSSVEKGILGFDGQEFDLAKKDALPPGQKAVTIEKRPYAKGKTLYVIQLVVQSSVPRPVIVFNMDARYATEMTPDGKSPNWKKLTTPDFVVTKSNTADNGDELLEGDLEQKEPPKPWPMWPLLVSGAFLVLLWPGLKVVLYLNRQRPGRVVPRNEAAWKILDRVFAQAKEGGFTETHYRRIASALRMYLGVEPATSLEVGEQLADNTDLAKIESALSKCDRVLYGKATLTDAENAELICEIEAIVPRPFEV